MHFDYYNSVGLIYDDYIYINKKDCLVRLESKLIKNIYFKKEKTLTKNYLMMATGLVLYTVLILLTKSIPLEYRIIGYSMTFLIALAALSVNFNHYKIIITTINRNIITTNINAEYKEEALELVTKVKQNITPRNVMLKAM